MISISLSPNTERDDVALALRILCLPWTWTQGKNVERVERAFAERFGFKGAFSFNSGRSALMAILHALDLQKGDEVLVQAFTCNAVPNPVRWARCVPVYVDCEDTWNMDPDDLQRKITPKSRAVIIQHTFGVPANIDAILAIARANRLIVIEDCAHSLGATHKGRPVGTFGDVALFSFSRDKIISCVYGGMAASNNPAIAEKIRSYQKRTPYPSLAWTLQQLLHPILLPLLILPTYPWLGKYLLVLLQRLHILSKAVSPEEKRGERPSYLSRRLPNALAALARHQFNKLDRLNAHRSTIAALYQKELGREGFLLARARLGDIPAWLRFPVCVHRAHEILRSMRKKSMLIGDWYESPVAPADTNETLLGYARGSCPNAERLAKTTLNLPTHIRVSPREAERIVRVITTF